MSYYAPENLIPRLIKYFTFQVEDCTRLSRERGAPGVHKQRCEAWARAYKAVTRNLESIQALPIVGFHEVITGIERLRNTTENAGERQAYSWAIELMNVALYWMQHPSEPMPYTIREKLHKF